MRESKKRRAVELAKDVLIVLLTCSALWLAARTQLMDPLSGLLGEDGTQMVAGPDQGSAGEGGALVPMAMVVNLPREEPPAGSGLPQAEGTRAGILYDQAACQELFQQVSQGDFSPGTPGLYIGENLFQIPYTRSQALHVPQPFVYPFQLVIDRLKALSQPGFQGALQLLIHRLPHAVQLTGVVLL